MRTTARRVTLLTRDHEARAHGVLVALTVEAATLAHPDAAQRGIGKTAVVIRKAKVRLGLPRIVVGAQPEIRVQRTRIDDLPWVHFALRIPNRFELTEGLHELFTEHELEQLPARLTVTVLTGDRPLVLVADELRGLHHELAEPGQPLRRQQVKADPTMDAAHAEVSVERSLQLELVHQRPQVAQVFTRAQRRHG